MEARRKLKTLSSIKELDDFCRQHNKSIQITHSRNIPIINGIKAFDYYVRR